MSFPHKSEYKKLDRNDKDIQIYEFNMDSMIWLYNLYDNIEQCKQSETIYMGELLNNGVIISMGVENLYEATKEAHNNFTKWYPWLEWCYRIVATTGIGPYQFVYDYYINQYVPVPVNLSTGYLIWVYSKKKDFGKFLWCKKEENIDEKNKYKSVVDLLYDDSIFFFAPDEPDPYQCREDNLLRFINNLDVSPNELITPWKSTLRSIIKKYRNYIIFEENQLNIGQQKANKKVHVSNDLNFNTEQYMNWKEFYNSISSKRQKTRQELFNISSPRVQNKEVEKEIMEKLKEGVSSDDIDLTEKLLNQNMQKEKLITNSYDNYMNDSRGIIGKPYQMQGSDFIIYPPNTRVIIQQPSDESPQWSMLLDDLDQTLANSFGVESNKRGTSLRTKDEIRKNNQLFLQRLNRIKSILTKEANIAYTRANITSLSEIYEEIEISVVQGINQYVKEYHKIPKKYEKLLNKNSDGAYLLNDLGVEKVMSEIQININFQQNSYRDTDEVIDAYNSGLLSQENAERLVASNLRIENEYKLLLSAEEANKDDDKKKKIEENDKDDEIIEEDENKDEEKKIIEEDDKKDIKSSDKREEGTKKRKGKNNDKEKERKRTKKE